MVSMRAVSLAVLVVVIDGGNRTRACSPLPKTLPFAPTEDCAPQVHEASETEVWRLAFATSSSWGTCVSDHAVLVQECPPGKVHGWTLWARGASSVWHPTAFSHQFPMMHAKDDWDVELRGALPALQPRRLVEALGVACPLPGVHAMDNDAMLTNADKYNLLEELISEGLQLTIDQPIGVTDLQLARPAYTEQQSTHWRIGVLAPSRPVCTLQSAIRTPKHFWDAPDAVVIDGNARWLQWTGIALQTKNHTSTFVVRAQLVETVGTLTRGTALEGTAWIGTTPIEFRTWADVMYGWRAILDAKAFDCNSQSDHLPIRPPFMKPRVRSGDTDRPVFDISLTFHFGAEDGNIVPDTLPPCWEDVQWRIRPDKFKQCSMVVEGSCHDTLDWAGTPGHEWKQSGPERQKTRWAIAWEVFDGHPSPYGSQPHVLSWYFARSERKWADTWTSGWREMPEVWALNEKSKVWRNSLGRPHEPLMEGDIVTNAFHNMSAHWMLGATHSTTEWDFDGIPLPSLLVPRNGHLPGVASLPSFDSSEPMRSVAVIPECPRDHCVLTHRPTGATFDVLSATKLQNYMYLKEDWTKMRGTTWSWFVNVPIVPMLLPWIYFWSVSPLK